MEPKTPERPTRAAVSSGAAAVIYGALGALGALGAVLLLDQSPLKHAGVASLPMVARVLWGAGVGVAVVGLDRVGERFVPALRRMGEGFAALLGGLRERDALLLAALSSVGEELFFRGFLQPWIGLWWSSLLFGLLHLAPDRRLWMWPLLAAGMGLAFGGLFAYTGDLLAPVLAHFTINYFNLSALAQRRTLNSPLRGPGEDDG
jgi:membrane protease YdiL (CAAX protease family)